MLDSLIFSIVTFIKVILIFVIQKVIIVMNSNTYAIILYLLINKKLLRLMYH